MQPTKTFAQRSAVTQGLHTASVIAMLSGLVLLGETRVFDCLRAASYCIRSRKGVPVSLSRLDQESNFGKDCAYVVIRACR